jgi:TRAP-type C4-dicarboxylate transport system substrate-binding protein
MKVLRFGVATVLLAALAILPVRAANIVIKLGTIAPDGSVWAKSVRQLGDTWRKSTDGRVALQVYAGGTQGSESAMIKRLNFGQLQAASFTAIGLAEIDDAFNVFAIPMFYENYGEMQYVLGKLTPALDARLEARRFKRINWGLGGWVQVFSTEPIKTVEDAKALKIFTSEGDDRQVEWYKENGFKPVPLAVSDMMTSLQTGMVQAIPVTPLSALAFQWYQQTPYMLDLGLAPLVGANVMSLQAWNRIAPADQQALLAAATKAEQQLNTEVPKQDAEALAEMEKRGLKVTHADDAEWRQAAVAFGQSMRGSMVPADIYDMALAARDAYRKTHGGQH